MDTSPWMGWGRGGTQPVAMVKEMETMVLLSAFQVVFRDVMIRFCNSVF